MNGAAGVLRGSQAVLRPVVEADRAAVLAIRRTPEVAARWWADDLDAEFSDGLADPDLDQYVVELEPGRVVGMVQWSESDDPQYRHASVDVFVDPAFHRRGLATDALRTLIDHLFDDRGHHRLVIDPAADNDAAIACYSRLGFRVVGTMREYELQADGRWADGLLMELLVTDRPWGSGPPGATRRA